GVPFLVEEYLGGGTLADRLRGGPLAIDQALDLGITLSEVLAHLHAAGIVHCDLKPSNIGFTYNGVIKLLDFGLAHLLRGASDAVATTVSTTDAHHSPTSLVVTRRGLIGTPPYMSPQAIHAERPAPTFDLWSLSVVLYESIGGQRPFRGKDSDTVFERIEQGVFTDLSALRDDCPRAIADFFRRALAVDMTERPGDARALRSALFALRSSLS